MLCFVVAALSTRMTFGRWFTPTNCHLDSNCDGTQVIQFTRNVAEFLHCDVSLPTTLENDNQAALNFAALLPQDLFEYQRRNKNQPAKIQYNVETLIHHKQLIKYKADTHNTMYHFLCEEDMTVNIETKGCLLHNELQM